MRLWCELTKMMFKDPSRSRHILIVSVLLATCVFYLPKRVEGMYVLPDNANATDCPKDSITDCYSFAEIVRRYTYHGPNAEYKYLYLLPGIHTISTRLEVWFINQKNDITITGPKINSIDSQAATIHCLRDFGIAFNDCKQIKISNIRIRNCSFRYATPKKELIRSAIVFSYCSFITINWVTIEGNSNTSGLFFYEGRHFTLANSLMVSLKYAFYVEMQGTCEHYNPRFPYLQPCEISVSNCQFKNASIDIFYSLAQTIERDIPPVTFRRVEIHHCAVDFNIVTLTNIPDVTFTNITMFNNFASALILLRDYTELSLNGTNRFYQNTGSVIQLYHKSECRFSTQSTAEFTNNFALGDDRIFGSVLYAIESTIRIHEGSHILFENNTGRLGGGITADSSLIMFLEKSVIHFNGNIGTNGGAIALYKGSALEFYSNSMIYFVGNLARLSGGAIYIQDSEYQTRFTYFLTSSFFSRTVSAQPALVFTNNTASLAGRELYGGWIDWQELRRKLPEEERMIFDPANHMYFNSSDDSDNSLIASDPVRVCMCTNSQPNCSINVIDVTLFPGETYQFDAVAVGQRYGTVPSIVLAEFDDTDLNTDTDTEIAEGQYVQKVESSCSALKYTIKSYPKREATLNVKLEQPKIPKFLSNDSNEISQQFVDLFKQLYIRFSIKTCSLGFEFDEASKICICQEGLVRHGIQCDAENFTIIRREKMWVNATFEHIKDNTESGVIVHPHCPFDYCLSETEVPSMVLENPEKQCAFNRIGTLCGACSYPLSHVLGTSCCQKCSSYWTFLIPVFALAGVVLVVALIVLNMTVSTGTINGLIFYANIVQANQAAFFPPSLINSFPKVFIAWLNLDLGIEVCFYNGLDAYVKTWLQFVFPIYIWILVAIIIIACHYSIKASKFCGNNAVKVLATLFLLSYAKILRNIITVLSNTNLEYPNGFLHRVWLYDGNLDYLRGRHIPLFLVALLMLVCLSAPYTTILFFIQWAQLYCHHRIFNWVRTFKPIFDAYTGPYKDNHRYWTGLLLLIRVILFIVFSLNTSGDPTVNLISIVIISFCIISYLSFIGGVYKSWPINLLEISFLMNIGIVSAATLYEIRSEKDIIKSTYTSTIVAFLIFVGIVIYHATDRILTVWKGKRMKEFLVMKSFFDKDKLTTINIKDNKRIIPSVPQTRSVFELRESLLSTTTS